LLDAATRATIERKLALLVAYTDELRPLVQPEKDAPAPSNVARRAIERLIQVVVEVATDVNELVVVALGRPQPQTSREGFRAMVTAGVLPEKAVQRFITSYVGLRNRIVHDYDTLDAELVLQAARRLLSDAVAYGRLIRAWVAKEP